MTKIERNSRSKLFGAFVLLVGLFPHLANAGDPGNKTVDGVFDICLNTSPFGSTIMATKGLYNAVSPIVNAVNSDSAGCGGDVCEYIPLLTGTTKAWVKTTSTAKALQDVTGKNKPKCAKGVVKLGKVGTKTLDLPGSDGLKLASVGLKMTTASSVPEKIAIGTEFLGASTKLVGSYLSQAGVKDFGDFTAICGGMYGDVKGLCESDNTRDRVIYGLKLVGNTATLAALSAEPVFGIELGPYAKLAAKSALTTSKVLGAVKFTQTIASKAANRFYYKDPVQANWTDESSGVFKLEKSVVPKSQSYIQCEYEDKLYWALDPRSAYLSAKGRWTQVADEEGNETQVFALKDGKRAVLNACKTAIRQEVKSRIDESEIKFYARSSSYSFSYPAAVSLGAVKGGKTQFQVLK